jgi:DNA-binding transcriptional regulator YdaS (Cro superfamily)
VTSIEAIKEALCYFGTQRSMAEAVGVTQPFISHLLSGRKEASAELCIKIERALKKKVTAKQLRPDIFG